MFTPYPRIGFACKIQSSPGKADAKLNTKTTTIKWLSAQTRDAAYTRLYEIAKHNLTAIQLQLEFIAKLPPQQRMFRISSDILPAYTHLDYAWVYIDPQLQQLLESNLAKIGEYARQHDIRLSFHPGQFCVLASDNPGVVENSIYEFEYHVDLIRMMGFAKTFQDFKCNVHIGGKGGPDGFRVALTKLSVEAQRVITVENAEFSWGLDASLELAESCALVLDIHHHWIMSGEYITPDDDRVKRVIDSWRGVRPVIHYSLSREEVLGDHCKQTQPDLHELLSLGYTRAKLRAHSDYYWNEASNQWALQFQPQFDIMCESKEKNLASQELYNYALSSKN